jgi:hypothetical protein
MLFCGLNDLQEEHLTFCSSLALEAQFEPRGASPKGPRNMTPDPITAITAWTHRSSNEKIRLYGRGEEPGLSEVARYLTEHGITAKSFPKGEDGREVIFRGERKKLKGLVKDLLGEAIDDSWEWGTFH